MTAPVESRQGRVAAYGLWQLRDYLLDRGAPTLIVLGLFSGLQLGALVAGLHRMESNGMDPRMIARYGSKQLALAGMRHDMGGAFLHQFLGVAVYLGALFAMQGIVANDRTKGFFRFLFAKPISPVRYYGQAFVIHGIGYLALIAILGLIFGHYFFPIVTPTFLIGLAAMWVLYAGLTFLFSASVRFDWMLLVVATLVGALAWDRWGQSTSPATKLLYLLPPLHRTDEVYRALAENLALPLHLLWWFAAYGAACYLLGLVVLRYRRLAIP